MSRITAQHIDRQVAVLSGQIHILQRQESELRALLDALALEKHALEAERDQLETGAIPFHQRVPPELLIYIFVLATYIALDPAQSRLDIVPFSISHVCRRWREIALSTPVLWRRVVLTPLDISHRHPVSPATLTFLERSKGIPAEVFYVLPSDVVSFTPPNLQPRRDSERRQPLGFVLETSPPLTLCSLYIHGGYDIISSALSYLHKHATGFASLQSLELALLRSTPGQLYDGLRLSDPEHVYCNPWHTHRFPSLQTLTLRDIPLPCVALGQLPALRDLTLTLDPLPGRLDPLRLPFFVRLLACAPHVERLSLLRAGPVFSAPLETSLHALRPWEDDPGWRTDSPSALPPVPLENLRELEWTDVHPRTLHLFLMHFPTPRLEVMDVAFANASKCKKLVTLLHPDSSDPLDSVSGQPVLELSNLKALHVDCSSGDELRSPFLRLFFPTLETLSLSNRNMSVRWAGPHSVEDDSNRLPQLPRLESIFRDPRMPRLTHLLLSGFAIPSDQVSSMLGYMPSIQRLECNFIPSITAVIDTLATARSAGSRICPHLRHIQLCYCDGVEPVILSRLIKLRNGFESEEGYTSREEAAPKRPMKRLPKGPHTTPAVQSPWLPTEERWVAKIEQVSLEGCLPITREEARSLEQWRVEVDWAPARSASE
ncbi:hypothetical protein BJY52DRAFT_1294693 [Lactarius psammicola]|nr:hypothetical protein BJY52DRAFT_1294693 [Lactarius psammicola]